MVWTAAASRYLPCPHYCMQAKCVRTLVTFNSAQYLHQHVSEILRPLNAQVQVDLSLSIKQPGNEEHPELMLAVATGIYKKMRAM